MSRLLPVLLVFLVVATGVGLALQLLSRPVHPVDAAPTTAADVDQGHLYTGIAEEPNDFNPFTTGSNVARRYVFGFTHETLLDLDPATGRLRGALAEAWEVAADGMSMTVTLRPDVRFCDGTPLTAEDVLYTWEVARGQDVVLGSIIEGMSLVAGVELLPGTPARLRIAFDQPHIAAAQLVGTSWPVVQKRWFLDRLAERAQRDGVPVPTPATPGYGTCLASITSAPGPGTGPYVFAAEPGRQSWRPQRDLTLFRSEHHWRRQAEPGCWNFAGVRLLFIADDAARYAALHQRAVDWFQMPELQVLLQSDAGISADYRRVVYDTAALGAYLVQWNTLAPAVADVRVRMALSLLFDRARIAERILGGSARPAAAFAKLDDPAYPRDAALAFDPVRARQLLRDAGFANGAGAPLHVRLLVPVEAPWFRQMAEIAAGAARTAGVELELQIIPWRDIMIRREGSDWDGVLMMIAMPAFGDPYELFHSKGGRNKTGWSNARADELLTAARIERDAARRSALLREFHGIVAQEQPVSLLVHPLAEMLVNVHLRACVPGPLGLWPERFWVPREFQRPGP